VVRAVVAAAAADELHRHAPRPRTSSWWSGASVLHVEPHSVGRRPGCRLGYPPEAHWSNYPARTLELDNIRTHPELPRP
jgi:hypothetical protein